MLGIVHTFTGLLIFMVAVKIGFMPVGFKIGVELAGHNPAYLVIFGFVTGMATVLAEPAIHVLNKQVDHVTGGMISKKSMMTALCIGVGISIALSLIRIIFNFSILYYVIPGYIISLGLLHFHRVRLRRSSKRTAYVKLHSAVCDRGMLRHTGC